MTSSPPTIPGPIQPPTLHAVAIKIPSLWTADPALWLASTEAEFALRGPSAQQAKFFHIVGALGLSEASEVRHVISFSPAANPYNASKKRADEDNRRDRRLRQFFTAEDLGDGKSSRPLRHIQ